MLLIVRCSEILHVILSLYLFFVSSTLFARQHKQTSLVFLDRNILSSDDILSCSTQEDIQNILSQNQSLSSSMNDSTNNQQMDLETDKDILLGFPLTILNRPIALGGIITDLPNSGETDLDRMNRRNVLAEYRLSHLVNLVQARITSDNQGCFLTLVYCPQSECFNEEDQLQSYAQFPVLGVSNQYQALIVDPSLFGRSLSHQIAQFPVIHPIINMSSLMPGILTEDSQVSIVGFFQSTLIFDIISTINWSKVYFWGNRVLFMGHRKESTSDEYLSEMTSRWFIKFNIDAPKDNFVARASIDGIETINTYSPLYDESIIRKWRSFDDNGNPFIIKYYVKNVPEMWQSSFQEGFEYWNSIFRELTGNPIFTYRFIQGDYDDQQEIITGDIRFNVLEWDTQYKKRYSGSTLNISNNNTGEIWTSGILIQGPRLVDEHQRWFQYSQMIRIGQPIEGTPLSLNHFERDIMKLVSQVDLPNQTDPHLQVVQLAPASETFENYMSGFFRLLVAHELGHTLGLDHYYMANIYAQDGYIGNSVMDLAGTDKYKPSSRYYDRMGIAYIYLGILPDLDQEVIPCSRGNLVTMDRIGKNMFPECSNIDATNNPLENFARELQETFNLLTEKRDGQFNPYLIWNDQVKRYVIDHVFGIMSYYISADFSYDKLQSVFIEGRRPASAYELQEMIVDRYITPFVCQTVSIIRNNANRPQSTTMSDEIIRRNIAGLQQVIGRYVTSYLDKTVECSF